MKKTLLKIADRLDSRIEDLAGFPRTQATDARREAFTDLSKIFREEVSELPDIPEDLDGRIHAHCMAVITDLLGDPAAAKSNTKSNKKGGSK